MTATDYANRLLKNIQISLELRSRVPYLDMLKDLAEGGTPIAKDTLNTSSNFGSFDSALREMLAILHRHNNIFNAAPATSPLPLTAIYQNLSLNLSLVIDWLTLLKESSSPIFNHLDTINLASV